jgi:hypothetical protein
MHPFGFLVSDVWTGILRIRHNYQIAQEKLDRITSPSLYKGLLASLFGGEIQSIRDIDASQLFPKQLTSTEKKRPKANLGASQEEAVQIDLLLAV